MASERSGNEYLLADIPSGFDYSFYGQMPLERHQIRLLHLQPSSTPSNPIYITLFRVDLNALPPFEAVSYRWGDATDTEMVLVNQSRFSVTANLFAALKRLRQAGKVITLWIDSICINQADIPERNRQVETMSEIFSRATKVTIWIGEETPGAAAAMQLIKDCVHLSRDRLVVARVAADAPGCLALTNLLQRSYWQRMWVFQEIILACNAVVQCGSHVAPWHGLKKLGSVAGQSGLWRTSQETHLWLSGLRIALFGIAQFSVPRHQARYLSNILQPTRQLQATDPRDKIYALMGVCQPLPFSISVDYSSSTRDIHVDFASKLARTDGNLSILLTAGLWNPKNGPDIDLPSWVPDFRGINGVDLRYLAASYLNYFDAAGGRDGVPSISLARELAVLEVEAIIIDVIQREMPLDGTEACRKRVLADFGLSHLGHHPTGLPLLHVFFRTMIFEDPTFHGGETPGERKVRAEIMSRVVLGFAWELQVFAGSEAEQGQMYVLSKINIPDFLDSFDILGLESLNEEYTSILEDAESLTSRFLRMEYLNRSEESTNRLPSSIFATHRNYIGTGLRGLQQDDIVCVVFGCRVPLVLRPHGSYYRLVGPCYLFGAMNGEITKNLGRSGESVEVQILRIV